RQTVAKTAAVERDGRGHELRRACDRAALLAEPRKDDVSGRRLDEDRRGSANLRPRDSGARRSRAQRGRERRQLERDRAHGPLQRPAHGTSLMRCPACSDCVSTFGFSASIRASGTPVFSAIEDSVSPGLTVYECRLGCDLWDTAPVVVCFASVAGRVVVVVDPPLLLSAGFTTT